MVTLDNPCTYFATADQQYRQVGYGVTLNGIPLPVQRLPVDVVHRLPLQYGDSDSSQSVINLTVPTMGHYGQSQMRYNQVDGYGTLHLPSGSFEVLRVASRLVRSDTVYVDQFGFGMRLPVPETVEYKWLAPGHGRPVLEVITTAGLVTSVRYFVEPATSVTTVPGDGGLQGPYPNPANERFTARFGPSGRVEVLAMDGRVLQRLQGKPGTQRQVDVSAWPVGMYMVTTEGAAWRLMIAR